MSLLDDVSIAVTPNGYKAGELYAVVPVPTEGSEEVTNGDFATDSDWTKTGGATISGGQANIDGDGTSYVAITQTNVFTEGIRYKVTVDAVITSGLGLKLQDGANNENIGAITTTGLYEFDFIATSNSSFVIGRRTGGTAFDSSVDNVSVKEYTAADLDVTRATAATRVDENGLVNYAEIVGSEEVTNGDFATDSDWTKGGLATISSGEANFIDAGSNTYSYIRQNISQTSGKNYLLEFEVKNYVSGAVQVLLEGVSSVGSYNSNGIYSVVILSGTTNGYVELSRSYSGGTFSFSIDNVSVKEVTRDNVPRIDYTGGGCPHILAEPQRTNLVTDSVDIDTYFTNQVDATVTNDYGTSPTGENNSTRVQWADSTSFIYRAESVATDTSASIFVKGISGETVMFGFGGNVTTGTVYTFDGSWQRIIFTGSTGTTIFLSSYGGATATDFEVFGLQLEVGSFPTSYIPTSGSTVTRNQDQFSRDGIGSLINSTEGCVFGEGNFAESNSSSYNYFLSLSDGTANNRLEIRQSVSNLQFLWRVATYQSEISTSGLDVSSNFKFAVSYSSANIKFYVNGNLIGTISSPTLWTANTLNRLAFDDGAGGNRLSGKVKQLQVYKTALTDTQLAALTS